MTGPWPHPKSGILYFRKATPPDLIANRDRLADLGIAVHRERHVSLATRERRDAERLYRKVAEEVDAEWRLWRNLLENGPHELSHKNTIALAAEWAAGFLEKHQDNPQDAPAPGELPFVLDNIWGHYHFVHRSLRQAQIVFDLKQELVSVGIAELPSRLVNMMDREPAGTRKDVLQMLARVLVLSRQTGGFAKAEAVARRKGITITKESRAKLGERLADYQGKAWDQLKRYIDGNYAAPDWLTSAPAFTLRAPTPVGSSDLGSRVVTFGAIVEAEAEKRAAGQGSKPLPERSIKKYKRIAEEFQKFRGGSANAATISDDEAEAWRDAMLSRGTISNRTIADRMTCLITIINWGKSQRQHREAMARASSFTGKIERPSYIEKPADETSYTLDEARTVLLASRKETDASKRWLPWLLVYAGLRISEAAALRREDFFEAEGEQFFRVTTAGKRTLKTNSSVRKLPVHPAVQVEGLLEWVSRAPEGSLFRSSAASYMGRWIRSKKVGITRNGVSPNHGLRHLFVGLCRRHDIGDHASEYLAGHASPDVHAKYGSTDVMLPRLARALAKIEPLLPLPVASL